eukprot:750942-Hanusia_phi.AAC.14
MHRWEGAWKVDLLQEHKAREASGTQTETHKHRGKVRYKEIEVQTKRFADPGRRLINAGFSCSLDDCPAQLDCECTWLPSILEVHGVNSISTASNTAFSLDPSVRFEQEVCNFSAKHNLHKLNLTDPNWVKRQRVSSNILLSEEPRRGGVQGSTGFDDFPVKNGQVSSAMQDESKDLTFAGLSETLSASNETLTLFAPSNSAFNKVGIMLPVLVHELACSVVRGRWSTEKLNGKYETLTSVRGRKIVTDLRTGEM